MFALSKLHAPCRASGRVTGGEVCGQPHGRPRLVGLDLFASVSHSADRVTVALTPAGPVGIDVERIGPIDVGALASHVLGSNEDAQSAREFFKYWVRKESVVKATGDGIVVGLDRVHVSRPGEPALLLDYPGRSLPSASMTDLNPGDDYVAAVTVLAPGSIIVTEQYWTSLLA